MDVRGAGIEREYRSRRKTPRAVFLATGLMGLESVYRMAHGHLLPRWSWMPLLGFWVLVFARVALYTWRGRTLVGVRGITLRRAVTSRSLAWRDVYDIRAVPVPRAKPPARTCLTYVYDSGGRRFLLPHLDDWQVTDPHAEIAALREAAARHRGMTFERRPETEARIRRASGHRKAWERAVTGGLVAFGGGFLVWVVLLITTDHPPTPLLFLWIPLGTFAALAALLNWRWESQVPTVP
ncbi:PH domain-containing protein [Streptomyces sp. WI03-4A]|uniref:PH domain-containing protein n=1 Tax=Streptomyces sp. WI03-4A TaxID=3028706 RepID=UPI0029A5BCBA|nr:PH domain-containing protein [Streptomyces sp. WI03-4A]MDX2594261.1 PH domain-containing protein [Streptomyces sp. WI03-4A]